MGPPGAAALALAAALLACGHLPERLEAVNGQLDAFGVRLGSRTDHAVIQGVAAERQPCLMGYEYRFPSLGLTVAYTRRGAVRAVTVRDPRNAVLGVRPGDSVAQAAARLEAFGLHAAAEPDAYAGRGVVVSLLPDEGGVLFGVRVEIADGGSVGAKAHSTPPHPTAAGAARGCRRP